jgi:hypothetical protein
MSFNKQIAHNFNQNLILEKIKLQITFNQFQN